MIALGHPLNIGTLAIWLSVSGFGLVGWLVPSPEPPPRKVDRVPELIITNEGFTLGGDPAPEVANPSPLAEPVPVPLPPELPEIAEIEPLPPVPSLPAAAPAADPRPSAGSPAASGASRPSSSSGSGNRNAGASGAGNRSGSGSSGLSNSARIAAGRMPSPTYPPYSRRNNQQGTVIVEFTVDRNGRVISAYAKKPSPWPLLNQEAVNTVRLWKFPPGGVMTLQRPIVFQLR